MEFAQLSATVRKAEGKGAARRLRMAGQIPAVCYGGGMTSTALSIAPVELVRILRGEYGRNTVIKMAIDGASELLVMVRDYQRHPIGRQLLHADFIQVKLDEEITVEVPLVTVGRPAGVVKGGVLNVVYRRLPVRCRPDRIPVQVSIDVNELEMGDGLTAAKVQGLPEGVTIALAQNQTIVSVTAPEKEPVVEEAAAVPAEGVPVEGAAPGEGAPAAGAAPAAPGVKAAPGAAPAPAAEKEKKEEKGGKREKK
ncbi:MAG: 50S ribosomal protein L25 [Deltaproteobacteria bacterium]|nr:50S ribosomal protein L25 [Deltaproteobacteria bacterium]